MWHSSVKTRKKVGRLGLRPWPLRCLSQFLLKRKDRLLRVRIFLRTFHRWGDLGIYSICYSQLEGSKDSFPLDEIFSAFINIGFNKGY